MAGKYSGKQGQFAQQIREFAEKASAAIDATLREIVIEIGGSVIRMSPVGNPEIWAANVSHRAGNKAQADAYDAHVEVRNVVTSLTASNYTKAGKLKKNVKYAKPLTKTERNQNFNVNGLVAGKDYVGGRFRGNWQFSIGTPADGTLDRADASGGATLAKLKLQVESLTAGQVAYIVNNLPYAIPLEYGHSTQAPSGMVRVTLARFQQIVAAAAQHNKV